MPLWGAPAGDVSCKADDEPSQKFTPQDAQVQSPSTNTTRYQRPSPYPNNNRGKQNSLPSIGHAHDLQINRSRSSFSCGNPFQSQSRFSADNPFQNSNNSSVLSPGNPYSQEVSSPVHQSLPRPLFQSSPRVHSSGFRGQPMRFNTYGASRSNFNTPPHTNYSQSPNQRYHTPRNQFQPGGRRGGQSAKGGIGQRNGSFSNPGGSADIQKYIHPAMWDDPWKDLPATPMLDMY